MEDLQLSSEQQEKIQCFQEITAVDDMTIAFATLDSLNWDLERAVESHLTGDSLMEHDDIEEIQPAIVEIPIKSSNTNGTSNHLRSRNGPITRLTRSSARGETSRRRGAGAELLDITDEPTVSTASNGQHSSSRSDDEMSDSDYHDFHDDVDVHKELKKNRNNGALPLIPTDSNSVEESLHNFVAVFESRFATQTGAVMPHFFAAPLPLAIQEAFEAPGRGIQDRRPLAIYLHNDRSIAANIFPMTVLCKEEVSTLLRCQYITWPWDVTFKENMLKLFEWLELYGMSDVNTSIQAMCRNVEKFPLLLIITRDRGTYNLVSVIDGHSTSPQMMEQLMLGVDAYTSIRMNEANTHRERVERDRIRKEQEEEYEASMAADRARIEAKQREEREIQEAEERRIQEEEEEQMRRAKLTSELPEEPAEGAPGILTVKFRLPEGEQCVRRFKNSETLGIMIKYLGAKGFGKDQFRYFNSDFPKKDVSTWDSTKSFADLKFPAREQIFVEEQ